MITSLHVISVVDRLRFDAHPDPTFHFDADPYAEPILSLHNLKIQNFFILFTALPVDTVYLSPQRHRCHKLNFSDSILKFSEIKYGLTLHLVEMDTDPDPPK
jgi:hypothetical protein